MTPTSSLSPHSPAKITRRTALAGALWGAPAVAIAASAPAYAASTCETITLTIPVVPPANTAPNGTQQISLTGTDRARNAYVLTLTSTASSNTTTGQRPPATATSAYSNHNLSTQGSGWAGSPSTDGTRDRLFTNFAPSSGNAVVLNQRARVTPEPTGTVPVGTDSQTITFTFTKNGTPFTPQNLSIDIFDITSVDRGSRPANEWRQTYWDAVHFSVAPSTIRYTGTHAPYGVGTGNGTAQSPYRRSDGRMPTTPLGSVSDRFTFATFPSGGSMTYSNHDNHTGWHFISISGVHFEVGICAP